MSSDLNISEDNMKSDEKINSWKSRFKFPCGGNLFIFFQLMSGMGSYCFILSMPIYMASMLKLSDTTTTTIYHAKAGLGTIFNIFGALLADGYLGRSKTFLILNPILSLTLLGISILTIYTQKEGIIACYFLMALFAGLQGPAIRTIIADQIPQENKVMLSTFLHIIYFINNFGIIIIGYFAPVMHKDIYCFKMECYPLVFFVAFLLTCLAFVTYLIGYLMKLFIIFQPTNNLLLDIIKCIHLAVKKRIQLGKPDKDQTWLDYSKEKFDIPFIQDIKIAKSLLIFLIAHPLFWMVFEQLSSIWTLQAQYMDGMISQDFVLKADQMQTLNPILVVLLIPIFEIFIYPFLNKCNFKVPYRIMMGQVFTAFACASMIFIQLRIDKVINPNYLESSEIKLANFAESSIQIGYNSKYLDLPTSGIKTLIIDNKTLLNIKLNQFVRNISNNFSYNKVYSVIIYQENSTISYISSEARKQTNGGYSNVRIFNNVHGENHFSILLKAKVGINKEFKLSSYKYQLGEYVKCGVGLFEIFKQTKLDKVNEKLGEIILYPAESKTIIISKNGTQYTYGELQEIRLVLPTIIWQIIPYFLVTVGEVFFSVNTGIFIYSEAPISMKSFLSAAEYVCIALGNILILILNQILGNLSMVYMFLICGILVLISGVATGFLGYFYLKNKVKRELSFGEKSDSTNL